MTHGGIRAPLALLSGLGFAAVAGASLATWPDLLGLGLFAMFGVFAATALYGRDLDIAIQDREEVERMYRGRP